MPTHSGPNIVEDGLVLALDAADNNSYPLNGLEVEYLIVAGGGSGGSATTVASGGGGAGGMIIGQTQISKNTYSVVIGGGGSSNSNGSNSTFNNLTAIGGGRGAPSYTFDGGDGGSGGGAARDGSKGIGLQPSSESGGFGSNGVRYNSVSSAGGGGGAGGVPTGNSGRAGGPGKISKITGNEVVYAAGGAGRNGGGSGENGTPNTGEGGEGNGGGNGGSGIVVIRYKGKQKATGGDLIYRYKNYTVHVFENSDNFVVGNTITDITGNQSPATLQNGVSSSTDNLGILDFDGVDDFIIISNTNLPAPANNLTLECLFQRNSGRTIINYGPSSTNASKYYCFEITTTKLKSVIFTTTYTILSSITDINSNTWYHAVMTYDGSSMKFYINGVLESSTSTSGNISNNLNPSLNIGRKNSGSGEYINGKIAKVKLYNRALTPEEIQQNYNATKSRFGL